MTSGSTGSPAWAIGWTPSAQTTVSSNLVEARGRGAARRLGQPGGGRVVDVGGVELERRRTLEAHLDAGAADRVAQRQRGRARDHRQRHGRLRRRRLGELGRRRSRPQAQLVGQEVQAAGQRGPRVGQHRVGVADPLVVDPLVARGRPRSASSSTRPRSSVGVGELDDPVRVAGELLEGHGQVVVGAGDPGRQRERDRNGEPCSRRRSRPGDGRTRRGRPAGSRGRRRPARAPSRSRPRRGWCSTRSIVVPRQPAPGPAAAAAACPARRRPAAASARRAKARGAPRRRRP